MTSHTCLVQVMHSRGGGRKACSLPHLTWRYLEFNSHAEIARIAPQQRQPRLRARLLKVAFRPFSSAGDAQQQANPETYFSKLLCAAQPCLRCVSSLPPPHQTDRQDGVKERSSAGERCCYRRGSAVAADGGFLL